MLDKAEKNGAKSNKPIKKRSRIILDNLSNDEESDFETETDINIEPSHEYENEIIPIQNQNVLDNYIFHPLTTSQISKLEEFLLEVLGRRILKEATEKVLVNLLDSAKNDPLGIILAFDGWKNVSRQHLLAIDCKGKRETGDNIMQITEKLFIELQQMDIKVN
ncbi:3745_t:CDS:2, partial [Funneliformis caledonium]